MGSIFSSRTLGGPDEMQTDNFRCLFRVVEMALDGVFNHFTQVTQRIGFGRNSMTQGGSNKTSIDRILCDLKDNFHWGQYHQLPYVVKGGLYRAPAAASRNGPVTSQILDLTRVGKHWCDDRASAKPRKSWWRPVLWA
jgi:hypothetical protein